MQVFSQIKSPKYLQLHCKSWRVPYSSKYYEFLITDNDLIDGKLKKL